MQWRMRCYQWKPRLCCGFTQLLSGQLHRINRIIGIRTEGKTAENSASGWLCVDCLSGGVCLIWLWSGWTWPTRRAHFHPSLTFSHLLWGNVVFNAGRCLNIQLILTSRSSTQHSLGFRFPSEIKKDDVDAAIFDLSATEMLQIVDDLEGPPVIQRVETKFTLSGMPHFLRFIPTVTVELSSLKL